MDFVPFIVMDRQDESSLVVGLVALPCNGEKAARQGALAAASMPVAPSSDIHSLETVGGRLAQRGIANSTLVGKRGGVHPFVHPRIGDVMRRFHVSALAITAVLLLFVAHDYASRNAQAQTLTDRQILEALYDAPDGPNWDSNDPGLENWKTDADLGTWFGVTTDTDGRVTELLLTGLGLSGEIPPELVGLNNLEVLALSGNELNGEIPSDLSKLTELRSLSFNENQLIGEIPPDLSKLANLNFLSLGNNQLTGEIPPELGDLAGMGSNSQLALAGNQLTGEIPPELGKLTGLTQLILFDNQLSGEIPSEIGDMTELTALYLQQNQLSGPIPSELSSLSKLTKLRLDQNQLTGGIPPELGSLSELQWLLLRGNPLKGEIPPELGSLEELQLLLLNDNELTGEIPSELSSLTKLIILTLHNNELTGELPDLNALTGVSQLTLGGNDLDVSWSTFESGGNLDLESRSNLTLLFLHDLGLSGTIPTWLNSHTGLERLYLHDNDLSGELPDLNALTKLTELYLHDNDLSGELPDLDALTELQKLGLGGNDLDISWATFESDDHLNLSTRTNLVLLYLHDSGLIGGVPSWLGSHTGMTHLHLHGNDLGGGWEEALKPLTKLEELTMSRGAVSGPGIVVWLGDRPSNFLMMPDGASPAMSDAIKSRVTWAKATVDLASVYVPSHPRIARAVEIIEESAVDIAIQHRDGDGELLGGELSNQAVICLPVSQTHTDSELRLLKEEKDSLWRYLEPVDPPASYDPGAGRIAVCGTTDSFSQFVPAVVEIASGTGPAALISRIEPSIRSVTLSQGDVIRLSFDIYGRQDILDNGLGKGHRFNWSDGGAGGIFGSAKRPNEVVYTAPEAPGTHAVTVTSPSGACLDGDDADEVADRCAAKFIITVRRSSAALEERPAPENPIGEIPSVLVDAEGRQYEVFTPEEGGTFDGEDVTLSAEPGVVPNLEIVGVRVDAADSASNIGMTGERYTLAGMWHDIRAVDADESPVSGYVLQGPLSVCLPLPPMLSSNISDVALVSSNADGSLTILASTVRITTSGMRVCGGLSTLPASVAVGRLGSPAGFPTSTPDPEEPETPDTGGAAPAVGALAVFLLAGACAVFVGATLAACKRVNTGPSHLYDTADQIPIKPPVRVDYGSSSVWRDCPTVSPRTTL